MFTTCKPLILASASPRRQQILSQLGLDFSSIPADIDETPLRHENPVDFARRMAATKAETIATRHPHSFVIGADTVVIIDNTIIGKPADPGDALRTLQYLQGKTHRVTTGLSIFNQGNDIRKTTSETTKVYFNTFTTNILQSYINTGEPLDKAGSYGMQAGGGFLVDRIEGSFSNAIGLPMSTCTRLLLQLGIITPR
ncbi:MAG: septum formation protein Maf [Desulfobulbus sp.]|nr:MAG: septum formation protein Maf [Desulfobulbus sp.]